MDVLKAICMFGVLTLVAGHGRLIVPAARNCMWRFGFPNPKNYDDAGLYCGGFDRQWHKNKGQCGVCGDPADLKVQPHADGGKYSNGIIAKTWKKGQVVEVHVQITTCHKGEMEFRIGDFTDKKTSGEYSGKLNGERLHIVEADPPNSEGTDILFKPVSKKGIYKFKMQLPANLTCKRCVVQWWYRAANNWGCDKDPQGHKGKCGSGRGPQDTTVNCADVTIEE